MGAWGYELFQSDSDRFTIYSLSDSANLEKVEQKILANPARYCYKKASDNARELGKNKNDKYYLCLYQPSHPDLVQQHLNNGMLVQMINDLLGKGQGNSLCLLIACAMELGCNIPDWCREELLLKYKKCHLPPDGEVRFAKALRDYRNGVPYNFHSKNLGLTMETGNPCYDESEFTFMNLEDVPAGEKITQENTTLERQYYDFNHPIDTCGNCAAKQCTDGSNLKRCTGCKKRLYCSRICQKAHTPHHANLCPAFQKVHEESSVGGCSNCSAMQARNGKALKQCGGCGERQYCSVECQKDHWPTHKRRCKEVAQDKVDELNGIHRVKMFNVPQTW